MRKNLQLNPQGDGLAFLAMISWGCYSALIKKIGEWEYPIVAVTRRVYFYGILFLIPVLIQQKASWKPEILMKPEVLANFLFLVLHEEMTMASVAGAALIFIGLVISQKKTVSF
jgi:drug/metabolite transporter (DMT)-like permease